MNRKELLRFIFWEWIEPIGTALCIALLVMKYVMAIYVIPTGSMQPTLHGKGDYPHEFGDKVLVNKFVYEFTKPKKWDVIVFVYPYNIIQCSKCERDVKRDIPKDDPKIIPEGLICETNNHGDRYLRFIEKDYIKRCVATEGDELTIRDGNLLLRGKNNEWVYSKKTPKAQSELWRNIFTFDNKEHFSTINEFWDWGNSNHGVWDPNKKLLILETNKAYTLRFHNHYKLLGYGDKGVNDHAMLRPLVGDVQFDIELDKTPNEGLLEFEILWNIELYQATIDFKTQMVKIMISNKVIDSFKIDQNNHRFSFSRLDGALYFSQDPFNVREYKIENLNPEHKTTRLIPTIHYKGEAVTLTQMNINRDIYYDLGYHPQVFHGDDLSYKVQPGEYFAMGDNSYWSSDSRIWGTVPEDALIGKALAVLLPFHRIKLIY